MDISSRWSYFYDWGYTRMPIGIIVAFGFIRMNGEVWVAGHTNKNWYGLKREISIVLEGTGIKEPIDQLDT